MAMGFAYTANYGTNPLEDVKAAAVGGESRVLNIRLGTLGAGGSWNGRQD
eukprot:CAMPEP_0177753092 /NCGR_PEP_ID=MMETSP0491_2-20121128/1270_1 /TAXON_ID=63592 /ORGANISM="Tetraselmis chuii, Strain PLY429" /LENGTH=49 /DNA_ID=CAMNT_0019268343 /DNA_START=355 /DNA_END=504 /DNA_ORIENTATION=-